MCIHLASSCGRSSHALLHIPASGKYFCRCYPVSTECRNLLNVHPHHSPAAVAVSVIRDDARPQIPEDGLLRCTPDFDELMRNCWHKDPSIRPTFLEIVTRLGAMTGEISSSSQGVSSSSSSMAINSKERYKSSRSRTGSTRSEDTRSSASSLLSYETAGQYRSVSGDHRRVPAAEMRIAPPTGENIAIVFSDITSAASLWEHHAEGMKDATIAQNQLLRSLLAKHQGYQVRSTKERNTGEGSFCMVFQEPTNALAWCLDCQKALLQVDWPPSLLDHQGAAEECGDADDKILFKGLRVRMGIHVGNPRVIKDARTRRMDYHGPSVVTAAGITSMAHGGQILMSESAFTKVKEHTDADVGSMIELGVFQLPGEMNGM